MDERPAPGAIDRLVHEPSRLAILAVLSAIDEADFMFLLRQTGLTRGNLGSHAARLEEAGYVVVDKSFVARLPHTVYRLTPQGRAALDTYRRNMASILREMG